MAIQIPNPGTGNGATGDNEYVLWTKTKDNFSNTSHAASRLVGTSNGNVAEVRTTGLAGLGYGATILPSVEGDLNDHSDKTWLFRGSNLENAPTTSDWYYFDTQVHGGGNNIQFAHHLSAMSSYVRRRTTGGWSVWRPITTNRETYSTTTAASPNVAVDGTGMIARTSSSERYKDIIADLELDDEHYADAMSLNPIIYRSKSEIDNPDYHYYSFSAEALGAYDPAFTLWRDTETVTDDEGNVTEQPLDERQAEGINLNSIVAFLHATNVKQGKLIKELSARIGVLEEAGLDK